MSTMGSTSTPPQWLRRCTFALVGGIAAAIVVFNGYAVFCH